MKTVLVDADIIAYRAAFATQEETEYDARQTVDDICTSVMYTCSYPDNFTLGEDTFFYLTGTGNFRFDVATIKPYIGKRGEKPKHLQATRDQVQVNWSAEVVDGQEADDAIAIKATELDGDCTIVTIDKDLMMIPATHYNFVKGTWTTVSKAQGDRFFYLQLLTGDAVDNIQGVKGIGPKKAEKAYEGCTTVQEYYAKALEMYEGNVDELVENARLLWLRRYEGEMWEPPVEQT